MSTEMPVTPQTSAITTAVVPVTPPTAMQVLSSTSVLPSLQTVTIPIDQLNAFMAMQARLAKVEEDQQQRQPQPARSRLRFWPQRAKSRRLSVRNVRRASERSRPSGYSVLRPRSGPKRYALDGELARALGSQPLVDGGAEQLTQLLRDHFVVEPKGNTFHVRTQDFKSVGDYIGAMLGRSEFAHFLRAQNAGGGSGSRGGAAIAPTSPANPTALIEPRNFSEAVIMQMATAAKTMADPRLTPSVGFGLRGLTLTAKTG